MYCVYFWNNLLIDPIPLDIWQILSHLIKITINILQLTIWPTMLMILNLFVSLKPIQSWGATSASSSWNWECGECSHFMANEHDCFVHVAGNWYADKVENSVSSQMAFEYRNIWLKLIPSDGHQFGQLMGPVGQLIVRLHWDNGTKC